MRAFLLLSLTLNFLFCKAIAQDSESAQASVTSAPSAATTSFVSLTPAMSSSSVSSYFAALATSAPQQPGDSPSAGDANSSPSSGAGDSDAGASGSDSGSITISKGGIIAIIVCVTFVVVFGIASSVLWYLAKKRSWEVRKTIRRSAKRVATALTPRRSTFPKDVQQRRSTRGASRIDDVPPTPKIRSFDVEKGNQKISSFEMSEPPKESKWARKLGR